MKIKLLMSIGVLLFPLLSHGQEKNKRAPGFWIIKASASSKEIVTKNLVVDNSAIADIRVLPLQEIEKRFGSLKEVSLIAEITLKAGFKISTLKEFYEKHNIKGDKRRLPFAIDGEDRNDTTNLTFVEPGLNVRIGTDSIQIKTEIHLRHLEDLKQSKSLIKPKLKANSQKYSKIEQFQIPVENGIPNAAKRRLYSKSNFDNNGNLTDYVLIHSDSTSHKHIGTYKYENGRRVEQMVDGIRSVCTYNNSGDTLEVKEYGYKEYGANNSVIKRLAFTYGSNGKKSVVTIYAGNTDTAINKEIFTYNNLNLVIRSEYTSLLLPKIGLVYSVNYTYNSRGNVAKMEINVPSMDMNQVTNYVYNDQGWIVESDIKYNGNSDLIRRHIYNYNVEGLIIKEHFFSSGNEAFIDYVYTAK
ncbi:hypothetical protein [Pedobacter sp. JCM 36344]|uniref:hypothetical protein n=1 Tax=Pedobacter sp. JCM 36344 TaxID=3374280 RepID=UPI00397C0695